MALPPALKQWAAAAALALFIQGPAHSRGPAVETDVQSPVPTARQPAQEEQLQPHGHYTNRDGQVIHSPTRSRSGGVPSGASAQCRDGTYSFSTHRRGTCSHHGGVAAWL